MKTLLNNKKYTMFAIKEAGKITIKGISEDNETIDIASTLEDTKDNKENNYKLQLDTSNFIDARLERSRLKTLKTKRYKKMLTDSYRLFDKIETIVNNVNLTDNYRDVESELASMQLKEAYKTGFKDSMRIFLYKEL